MSTERLKLSNGWRVATVAGLIAIFMQLAVIVWGAATLTARVETIEGDHVQMKIVSRTVQVTMSNQAVSIGEIQTQVGNIDRNVQRLLDE